jgi:hypothetical protein
MWKNLGLLNSNLCFNTDDAVYKDIEDFNLFVPQEAREEIGEANLAEELAKSLKTVNRGKFDKDHYLHPNDGITYIDHVIVNAKTTMKYFKLFNIGYEWDETIQNYWNGKAFSVKEFKWLSLRKD